MSRDTWEFLEEARDSTKAAMLLLATGYPGYAASRAYYAMFYVAQAFLEAEGMAFSKHSAVQAAFGRYFANAGKVPREFHRQLLDAFALRLHGDYGRRPTVSPAKAAEIIAQAERFVKVAEEHFGPLPPPQGAEDEPS